MILNTSLTPEQFKKVFGYYSFAVSATPEQWKEYCRKRDADFRQVHLETIKLSVKLREIMEQKNKG